MTDFDRSSAAMNDGDRLPWLEAVDDEDEQGGVGVGKLIAAVIAALVVIGLVVGGVFWLRDRARPGGEGDLIAAPAGDYKIPAAGPAANGMAVEGEGDAAFAASQGKQVNSAINVAAKPEAPVGTRTTVDAAAVRTRPAAPPPVAVPPAPKLAEAKPVAPPPTPAKPAEKLADAKPASAPGGAGVQLGAFSSQAIAQAEWGKLTAKFTALSGLSHSVSPVPGKSLYRLRAAVGSSASAKAICAKVSGAGKPCAVVSG